MYLWAVEDLRSLLVEDDGLAVDVAGQAAGHGRQEDEDDVGGHRGRVLTPGARPSVRHTTRSCCARERDLPTNSVGAGCASERAGQVRGWRWIGRQGMKVGESRSWRSTYATKNA